jgi:hypothetical protein
MSPNQLDGRDERHDFLVEELCEQHVSVTTREEYADVARLSSGLEISSLTRSNSK